MGGDSTIPPLNNTYRDESEQFANAQQITQVMTEGGIVSKKPGVINMPSWKGVINDAQASAIAAYILAGFPHTGATYDPDPAKPSDIYSAYACIECHGQVGSNGTPSPAPNPEDRRQGRARAAQPGRRRPAGEFRSVLMDGSIPDPGTKGVIFMPAWGQILSRRPGERDPAVHRGRAEGRRRCRRRCRGTPLPLAGGALVAGALELGVAVMSALASIVAQGIPLAPSLEVRLIALVVVEVVLLTTAVLLYILWVRFKREPLDEWWEGRKQAGFSPRTRALMEEESASAWQPRRPPRRRPTGTAARSRAARLRRRLSPPAASRLKPAAAAARIQLVGRARLHPGALVQLQRPGLAFGVHAQVDAQPSARREGGEGVREQGGAEAAAPPRPAHAEPLDPAEVAVVVGDEPAGRLIAVPGEPPQIGIEVRVPEQPGLPGLEGLVAVAEVVLERLGHGRRTWCARRPRAGSGRISRPAGTASAGVPRERSMVMR